MPPAPHTGVSPPREGADADLERVASAISAHLANNPRAADTVEGVLQWWLGGELAAMRREVVEAALEWLVARGVVMRRTKTDKVVIYCKPPSS
jgi:hypothetical protein